MWTKLRPFVRAFLDQASKMFELSIYTHGNREYAVAMARLLDPHKQLFAERIISAGDSTQMWTKDSDIALTLDSTLLILDDTRAVWPRHAANLLHAERYLFFPSCVRSYQVPHKCLLDMGTDESASQGMLATALGILSEVHSSVFAASAPGQEDVREHLTRRRRQVLRGVHIAFSCVMPIQDPRPEGHELWQLALQLGAQCSREVGPHITHVVSRATGSDKVRWAARHKAAVVSPEWLVAAGFRWQRLPEASFPVQELNEDN
eukprot:jgi/Astpho2/9906/fgenesh1_pm.00152_%23_9_t